MVRAVEVKGGLINAIAVGDYRNFVLRRPLLDYGDAVIMPGLIDVLASRTCLACLTEY
jgi:allantoinase/DNA mismatch repair protein MutS2